MDGAYSEWACGRCGHGEREVQEQKAEARNEARAHARHGDHEELAVSDDRERAPAQTPDEAHEQRGRGNQARTHRHFFYFCFFSFFLFRFLGP
jgi:hypothetical protein